MANGGSGAGAAPPRDRRGGEKKKSPAAFDAAEDPKLDPRPRTEVSVKVNEFGGRTTITTKRERDGDHYRIISIVEIKYDSNKIVKARTHLPVPEDPSVGPQVSTVSPPAAGI